MTIYTIDNQSPVGKAFTTADGFQIVAAGKKAEVETAQPLTEAFIAVLEADNVKVTAKKVEKASDGLKAEHHGGGKFRITEGETVILTDLNKADADAFNALSAEDKAAFVAGKSQKTDAEIVAAFTDEEKTAYEALDDAGKAKFVADKKAA